MERLIGLIDPCDEAGIRTLLGLAMRCSYDAIRLEVSTVACSSGYSLIWAQVSERAADLGRAYLDGYKIGRASLRREAAAA